MTLNKKKRFLEDGSALTSVKSLKPITQKEIENADALFDNITKKKTK